MTGWSWSGTGTRHRTDGSERANLSPPHPRDQASRGKPTLHTRHTTCTPQYTCTCKYRCTTYASTEQQCVHRNTQPCNRIVMMINTVIMINETIEVLCSCHSIYLRQYNPPCIAQRMTHGRLVSSHPTSQQHEICKRNAERLNTVECTHE